MSLENDNVTDSNSVSSHDQANFAEDSKDLEIRVQENTKRLGALEDKVDAHYEENVKFATTMANTFIKAKRTLIGAGVLAATALVSFRLAKRKDD